ILGTGPPQEVERLARVARDSGAERRVAFPGHVTAEEVAGWMRRADLFVLPSTYEPFGLVLLEALACGCSVVATNTAGPKEILTDPVRSAGVMELVDLPSTDRDSDVLEFEARLAGAIEVSLLRENGFGREAIAALVQDRTWAAVYQELRREYLSVIRN
ncbi:MAG TPA: glycosyltransferase, partial [Longimicrobiaceae bacterium]|nr:glycosyltransferase [Longimicrobiaceae bacterium]